MAAEYKIEMPARMVVSAILCNILEASLGRNQHTSGHRLTHVFAPNRGWEIPNG